MRRHTGVVTGSAMAGVGILLALAAFGGFSLGLPAVQPASALGASWFMIAVLLIVIGAVVALAARGLEQLAEEHEPAPARHLTLVRR